MADSPRDKLLKDMKRTKGARFNAAQRLDRLEQTMSRNTAYASCAVIVITMLPAFFTLPEFWVATIAILTIALSVFILVFTLVYSGNKNALKADQFQRCALEVNALRREMLSSVNADVSVFTKRYDEILARYSLNHDEVDYDKYRLEHLDEFENIASEDVAIAREKVTSSDYFVNSFAKSMRLATFVVVLAAMASSSPIVVELTRIILREILP